MLDQILDIEVIYDQAKKDNLLPSKEEVDAKFKELKKSFKRVDFFFVIVNNRDVVAQLKRKRCKGFNGGYNGREE